MLSEQVESGIRSFDAQIRTGRKIQVNRVNPHLKRLVYR